HFNLNLNGFGNVLDESGGTSSRRCLLLVADLAQQMKHIALLNRKATGDGTRKIRQHRGVLVVDLARKSHHFGSYIIGGYQLAELDRLIDAGKPVLALFAFKPLLLNLQRNIIAAIDRQGQGFSWEPVLIRSDRLRQIEEPGGDPVAYGLPRIAT